MSNEIHLYGSVGASFWDEEYFTPTQVREQLAQMQGPVTVRINSGGGFAQDGQTIYTMLVDYPDEVNVIVDGAAASAASLIAMAGDTVTMRLGAWMLIHDPAQMFTDGRGTAKDHIDLAGQLDIIADAYAAIYAKRAGVDRPAAREVMKADTMMDGDAAIAAGYATHMDADTQAAVAARFDYRLYKNAPDELVRASKELGVKPGKTAVLAMFAGQPRLKKENDMPGNTPSQPVAADSVATPSGAQVTAQPQAQPVPEVQPVAQQSAAPDATIAERTRARRIMDAVAMAGFKPEMANTFIDRGDTLESALDQIRAQQISAQETPQPGDITRTTPVARVTRDGSDKFRTGAQMALMAKVNLTGGERNEFSSLSLPELARECLMQAGERSGFQDRREMIGRAFTMNGAHGTSDFANILSNVMGKAALAGWDEAEETFHLWTRKGTLTDFKENKRVGAGLFDALPAVPEGGEYKHGTVGDRGEGITLATYGKLIKITRQAIINDDLSLLGSVPRKMGRAARRTVGNLAYAVLTGNPNLADGVALFHADHNNLAASGTVPSITSLSAARTAMKTQKEKAGGPSLNIRPAYALIPAALETEFDQLMNSTVDPQASKGHARNPVAGMVEPISDARLDDDSATAWYLAADPNAHDTIEVAYLDGNDAPYLEERTSWTSDGVEMKVRIDATAAPLDHRTFYKNAGS